MDALSVLSKISERTASTISLISTRSRCAGVGEINHFYNYIIRRLPLNILIIEEHSDWCAIMAEHFSSHGLSVRTGATLREMKAALQMRMPDILILESTLPDGSSLPELSSLRQRFPAMGIVIVTARLDLQDRVHVLCSGADYYLTKPVKLPELSATLAALARRLTTSGERMSAADIFWWFDRKTGKLTGPEGTKMAFTDRESRILTALLQNPYFPISNQRLLEALGVLNSAIETHRVDMLVYRIRRKLRMLPRPPISIHNVYNEGYVCTYADAINCA